MIYILNLFKQVKYLYFNRWTYFILTTVFLFLYSCKTFSSIATIDNNVCKTLHKKTVIYAVFVDSEGTHPWSAFDINSTLDSINISMEWLQKQASMNNVDLSMELHYAKKDAVIPFKEEFKYKTLSATLFKYLDLNKGIKLVDEWSNNVAKDVARTIPNDSSKIILTNNKSNDRERLIAKLRDIHKTDNIALIYFINNYYENELSVTFHSGNADKTEYAVASGKDPAVIAHEFLHLFGALDLYITPFDKHVWTNHRKRKAMKKYPNEIMAFAYRDIDSLTISPLTKYLIGWDNKIDQNAKNYFFGRRFRFLEY